MVNETEAERDRKGKEGGVEGLFEDRGGRREREI